MLLYEKFGFDAKLFSKKQFQDMHENLLSDLNFFSTDTYLYKCNKRSLIFDSSRICMNYYLIGEKDRVEHYVRPMFDYATDYFFGDWRKTTPIDGKVGEDFLKRGELWIAEYRDSILWASVLGEWGKAREISKYPDELCMEADFESKEKKAWYIVLAVYLRDESLDNASKFVNLIENGKKKREKLLLNVLRIIADNDAECFTKEFSTYMKHYKAKEFPQKQISEKLAIDGTILFNLARHQGMQVEFPDKYFDHYIHLD